MFQHLGRKFTQGVGTTTWAGFFIEMNADQRREVVNTRQRFQTLASTRARANGYKGSMVWSTTQGERLPHARGLRQVRAATPIRPNSLTPLYARIELSAFSTNRFRELVDRLPQRFSQAILASLQSRIGESKHCVHPKSGIYDFAD